MIYDGKSPVSLKESNRVVKTGSKKEGYWAGVARRFKMDWEYSKPTILGSLTGSVVLMAIVLLIVKFEFEEAFLESLIFVLSAFFFCVASGFVFRYMIPEKRFDGNKTTVYGDAFKESLQSTEQKLIEEEKLRNAMSIIGKFRGR